MKPLAAAAAFACACAAGAGVAAQAPPAFEVASIKPSPPNPGDPTGGFPRMVPANGRLTGTNVSVRLLMRIAFEVQDFQISGGPADVMGAHFDISAKAEDGTSLTTKNTAAMLRSLLAERFKLKTHTEPRDMPIYALVLARPDGRLGPDLKASTSDCTKEEACAVRPMRAGPGSFGLRASGQSLDVLVQLLTQATGRIVVDKTGLKGLYDFAITFDPEAMLRMAAQSANLPVPASVPSDSPALMTAVQEQLGLKLDSQRGPVDVLIVDHVEAPAPD